MADLTAFFPRADAAWGDALQQAMDAFDITTPERVAAFLANVAVESRELTALEENLSYRPARLLEVFPRRVADLAEATRLCAAGAEAIANCVYASRSGNGDAASGDGWRFRGRGPLGVTFRDNYRAASVATTGDAATLLTNPEFLALPEFGAAAAAWHWAASGANAAADAGDFDACCDLTNFGHRTLAKGDALGFQSRERYWIDFKRLLTPT